VHFASFPSKEKQAILSGTKAFQAFQENLKDRCEIPPNPQPLEEIGSHNFV
jgi:hypothetical protein